MKTETVDVRLPQRISDELRAIAKLAGLSVESVIKLIIAMEVHRINKSAETRIE